MHQAGPSAKQLGRAKKKRTITLLESDEEVSAEERGSLTHNVRIRLCSSAPPPPKNEEIINTSFW